MEFTDIAIGEAFTFKTGGSPAWRPILRKVDPQSASDDEGTIIPVDPSMLIDPVESVNISHAMWVQHGGKWKLVLRWTAPGDEDDPSWASVDPQEKKDDLDFLSKGDRRARVLLASGLHAQGDLAASVKIYDELIEECEEASLLNNRGAARAAMGDVTGAVVDYTRAVALDTRLAQAYSNRGNALTKLGKYEDAISDYNRAIELAGDVAPIYCNRGLTRKLLGDLTGSLEDFDIALAIDSSFAAGFLARGGVRALAADLDGAVMDLERFLELAPLAPQVQQVREAVKRLRGAISARPEKQSSPKTAQ